MADDPEKMDPSQPGEQAPETENPELKEIFDREIARGRNRRTSRIIVTGLVFFLLVLILSGIYLGSLPRSTPVLDSTQPHVTPQTSATGPRFTPIPDTSSPTPDAQMTTTGDQAGVIDGSANPGFPYWSSGIISYRFDAAHPCSVGKTSTIVRAFKIINDRTDGLVTFVKSPVGALSIHCHDSLGAMGASGRTTLVLSPRELISQATMDFYDLPPGISECDSYPTLEMHEALHTLGFEDTSSPGNVMYSGTAGDIGNICRELDAGIVNCLKNIYSNGERGQSCSGIPHT